ncbi:alpha/beta hydrolase [Gordonia hongkongensis]|uniref:alpha/beta hydrolase n=1 Tax=Gordonia hongkongensis TaxID=1701090 RepID=UPI003D0DF4ED
MITPSPDTIVLVHGLWVTPRSWEDWITYYQDKGYRVIAPPYPGFEVEVESLRENSDVIADLTVPATVDHLAGIIRALPSPPIIMGHSFGGVLTQLGGRPRARCGCGGHQLRADRRRTDAAPFAGEVDVPDPQALLEPPQGGRFHTEGVALRLHQHPERRRLARGVRPVRDRRARVVGVEVRRVREPHPGTSGDLGGLPARRPCTAALHRRRGRPHHAARGEQVEREKVPPVQGADGVPRVPRTVALDLR